MPTFCQLFQGACGTTGTPTPPWYGAGRAGRASSRALAVSYELTPNLRLFAAGGLHHQQPHPEDLSSVFGAPSLDSSMAVHATAGAALRLERLSLEATGFLRVLSDLATRSGLPTPLLAQALVQQGTGLAYGAQLVARTALRGPLEGFVSVLISHSQRQDLDGGPVRLFDFDQPLAATAAVSYRYALYTFGARLRVSSGFPRTPVAGSYFDAQLDRYDPIFGAQNSERLPLFAQLDLRAERKFDLGGRRQLKLSLEVQNVTARSNAEEYVYSSDWSSRGTLTGLPPLALLGVEVIL
ncbi:MAG TPA: TonB-dependent receptor [Myxococcales bacterium]|nr:TonB-dependent receptor [Myxococcales bacterium]